MGHHFSKNANDNANGNNNNSTNNDSSRSKLLKTNKRNAAVDKEQQHNSSISSERTSVNAPPTSSTSASPNNVVQSQRINIPPLLGQTINLQIEESPTTAAAAAATSCQLSTSSSSSLTSVNTACSRQIIIKIQLAKMENGDEENNEQQLALDTPVNAAKDNMTRRRSTDANLNNVEPATQAPHVVNVNFVCGQREADCVASTSKTAGSFTSTSADGLIPSNNNFVLEATPTRNNDDASERYSMLDAVEYCEVLEDAAAAATAAALPIPVEETYSSRNKTKATATPSAATSFKTKCCNTYRGVRRILEPSTKANKARDQQRETRRRQQLQQQQPQTATATQQHSNQTETAAAASSSTSSTLTARRHSIGPLLQQQQQQQQQSNRAHQQQQRFSANAVLPANSSVRANINNNNNNININNFNTNNNNNNNTGNAAVAAPNQFPIWNANDNSFIIPIFIPNLADSIFRVGHIDGSGIHLTTPEIVEGGEDGSITTALRVGPIVHSQVDFVHCLVPDLERITNSSFYWGKMDRYEAERLLEGKPEGTFLLRDSAQEEFLFSVTFRKYGRSLHARIEQIGHKFSFDCHDPGVYTARTVTGLLEHYKDPSCVMFFEPMLTIPLHRKTTFSLQQLCRATIVSNTTYDGINQLELPNRLKAYLKEYHYKQRLRTKPFDMMISRI